MSLEKFKLFFNSTIGADDELKAFLATNNGGLLTSTTAGGKEALDVNIASSDISINVLESDVYAEDSAHADGDEGSFMLAVRRDTPTSGTSADGDYASLNVNADGELWVKDADVLAQLQSGVVVSATDLDIRDLAFATDKVDVSGSSVSITGSVTVTATDLDIRDLNFATDSVTSRLQDGAGNAIESIGGNLSVADSVLLNSLSAPTVTTSEVAVTAVSAQKKVTIQNLSAVDIYLGPTGVTTGTGLLIPKKSVQEIDLAGTVYLIAGSAVPAGEVRVGHWTAT